jgi:hypothetical protein
MVEKFRNYIERGTWEEDCDRQVDLLAGGCLGTIVLAVLYFGWGFLQAWMEGAIR